MGLHFKITLHFKQGAINKGEKLQKLKKRNGEHLIWSLRTVKGRLSKIHFYSIFYFICLVPLHTHENSNSTLLTTVIKLTKTFYPGVLHYALQY